MAVLIESSGIKAEIVERDGFRHSLKLTANAPIDPEDWKKGNTDRVWEIPSYYLDTLIRLLPILQQLWHDR